MQRTKVWMLAILIIPFFAVSCDEEDPVDIDEAKVLVEWLESASSPAADYGNGALAIKSASATKDLMTAGKVYLIDIRKAEDFAKGHIADAVNLGAGEVRDHIESQDLSAYDEIHIICYSGQSASWLTSLLQLAGHKNVYSMKFGMSSWNADFDSWTANCMDDKYTLFETAVNDKAEAGELPELMTGKETAEEIFDVQWDKVLAEGFGAAAISNTDVYADLDGHYIINYWPNAEYLDPGHIEGAIQYTPSADLKSDAFLNTLPTDGTPVVVYCYTGQNSARVATYLRILGYNAKSLKFGANSMIYDHMPKSKWGEGAVMNYDYVVPE